MTRDQLTDEAEDMLFHTRGMSRREQAVALVNTLFWSELAEARAKALEEAAVFVENGQSKVYSESVNGAFKVMAFAIRQMKDRIP